MSHSNVFSSTVGVPSQHEAPSGGSTKGNTRSIHQCTRGHHHVLRMHHRARKQRAHGYARHQGKNDAHPLRQLEGVAHSALVELRGHPAKVPHPVR